MKYLVAIVVVAMWNPSLTAQEKSTPSWTAAKQLVAERTGAIGTICNDVDAILNEFRASPEFATHSSIWTEYIKANLALQSAVAAGIEVDEKSPLRKSLEATKAALRTAIDDSRLLGRVDDLLLQCDKLVDASRPVRLALGESARILREAKLADDRVADLKKEREKLAQRIADAKRIVTAQRDATVRAKNEQLVAQAEKQLAEMDQSLKQLEGLTALNGDRIRKLAGDDEAATRLKQEFAAALELWNDSQRRLKDAMAAMRQFSQLGPARTLDLSGTVKIRRGDGRVIEAASDTPLLPGDVFETGDKSGITVVFEDGSMVQLKENSKFEMALPGASNAVGALDFKAGVQRYLNSFHEEGVVKTVRKFERSTLERRQRVIRTPVCASAVRGCDMLVLVDDKELRVFIGEGEFILCHRKGEVVPGGHEITVAAGTLETTIRPLAAASYKKLLRDHFPDVE